MNAAEIMLREIEKTIESWLEDPNEWMPPHHLSTEIGDKIKAYFMAREIVADLVDVVDVVIDNMIIEK